MGRAGLAEDLLGAVAPLSEFKLGRRELSAKEMATIAEQAEILLRECYVHLPLKRAVHGVDPEFELRQLLGRVRSNRLAEPEFHDAMTAIFNSLRDLHTMYVLPRPYRRQIAFLPWMIEEYFRADGRRAFVVSKVYEPLARDLRAGTTVTHWNGVPIERAVRLLAAKRAGSNEWAEWARGVDGLTFRWMGKSGRPDEDEVTLTCSSRGRVRRITSPWYVAHRPEDGPTSDMAPEAALGLGLDEEAEWIRQVKRVLYATEAAPDPLVSPAFSDVLRSAAMPGDPGSGYLRIFSFNVDDPTAFVDEVSRVVARLPRGGLILDVRGNGGGSIVAAERLLQLFTGRTIEPEPLRFRNTGMMARVADNLPFAPELFDAMTWQEAAGIQYSPATYLADRSVYNDVKRVYRGPIVLLVDALAYSATDIFAAGFEDHDIGFIVGTAPATGAGGANVWGYETLRAFLQDGGRPSFTALPLEASFTVAVRQTSRVGAHLGNPLEHLGVFANSHALTRRDVLHGNADLLETAVLMLEAQRQMSDDKVDERDVATYTDQFLRHAATSPRPVIGYRILDWLGSGHAERSAGFLDYLSAVGPEAVDAFAGDREDDLGKIVDLAQPSFTGQSPQLDGGLRWLGYVVRSAARHERTPLLEHAVGVLFDLAPRRRRLGERMETRGWLLRLSGDAARTVAGALASRPRTVRWYLSEGWQPPDTLDPALRAVL
ncbi:S41 family peptidase [Solirubrobacter soli]|uniref:S41 family peptidase n=1 Tax=Solirubrobacter soli TaxID=363832 RepID=UPI0004138789|nr:S41 family peptidase [Solirubrobacter soli]